MSTTYYCYGCNRESSTVLRTPNLTCANCNSDFIEEREQVASEQDTHFAAFDGPHDDNRFIFGGSTIRMDGMNNFDINNNGGNMNPIAGMLFQAFGSMFSNPTAGQTGMHLSQTPADEIIHNHEDDSNDDELGVVSDSDSNYTENTGTDRGSRATYSFVAGRPGPNGVFQLFMNRGGSLDTAASALEDILLSGLDGRRSEEGNRPAGESPISFIMNLLRMGGLSGDYVMGQQELDDIISRLMEQTAGKNAPPPASEEVISQLPRKTFSSIKGNKECSICQDEFEQETKVIQLPCSHLFHEECLVTWLKMNGTCPVCRFNLVDEDSENQDNQPQSTASTDLF